jgi:NitT/TauT family transport system substrate-binding protein
MVVSPIVILALLLVSCVLVTPTPAPTPEPTKIKVGYMPTIAWAPTFVAIEKGYFAEQGLEVEPERFRSGALMIAPLAIGELDVASGQNAPSLFNAISKGMDIKVVGAQGSVGTDHNGIVVVVRKDLFDSGEVDTVAELQGRKVANNVIEGFGSYFWDEVLALEGLTVEDVEQVAMPFPDVPAALGNQAIDASILPEPLAMRAVGMGVAELLVPADQVFEEAQINDVFFGKNILLENPDVGERFMAALLKGARDLQGDQWRSEENLEAISKYTELDVEVLKRLPESAPYFWNPNGEPHLDSVMDMQQFYLDHGWLEYSEPLTMKEIYDSSFLLKALERLGRSGE